MNQRFVLAASVAALLPLSAQEDHRRPSPFPEKNRERAKVEAPARKTAPLIKSPRDSAFQKSRAATPANYSEPRAPQPGDSGKACFFASVPEGARTASGRQLDPEELVAAHATYPLGSRVKVVNVANGKSVEVEIVDRFPPGPRVINVSQAAARLLGFVDAGTAEVRLEPVDQGTASRER